MKLFEKPIANFSEFRFKIRKSRCICIYTGITITGSNISAQIEWNKPTVNEDGCLWRSGAKDELNAGR